MCRAERLSPRHPCRELRPASGAQERARLLGRAASRRRHDRATDIALREEARQSANLCREAELFSGAPQPGQRRARFEVRTRVQDPDGGPVAVYWWPSALFTDPRKEKTVAELPVGSHFLTVVACDLEGNCAVERLAVSVRPEDAPPGADVAAPPDKEALRSFPKAGKRSFEPNPAAILRLRR